MKQPLKLQSAQQANLLTRHQLLSIYNYARKCVYRKDNPMVNSVRISLVMNELIRRNLDNHQQGD